MEPSIFFWHRHKVALFRIDSGDGVGLAMPDAIWNPTQCGCPTWHNYLGLSCLNNMVTVDTGQI